MDIISEKSLTLYKKLFEFVCEIILCEVCGYFFSSDMRRIGVSM